MYNKLFTKILDSSIWMAPDATRLVWLTLIAAMDEAGIVQFASVANLAHRARVSLDAATEAVGILEGPDPHSSDSENEGRRIERIDGGWLIMNAHKYRALATREHMKEQTRERVRRYREKARNADVTQSSGLVTPSDTDTESKTEAKTEEKARKRAAPLAKPADVDQQVWADWIALRKAKRAPVTGTVVSEAKAEAAKAGLALEEFLRVWCARGSQGLQADWLKPAERGQQPAMSYRERDAIAARAAGDVWMGSFAKNRNVIDMEESHETTARIAQG